MPCRRLPIVLAIAAAGLAGAPALAGSAPVTTLRLDGIGPLKLGMKRSAALATGWLAGRRPRCPLGGAPIPLVYTLTGVKAPHAVAGTAEFDHDRLKYLVLTRGVRTTAGVTVRTTTLAGMKKRYRQAGYGATSAYSQTFGGTFVAVTKAGHHVIAGFGRATRVTTLAVPVVPLCD